MFMKKQQIITILLGSFVFLNFGCSAVKIIHTDQVPGFSLSSYESFDFYELAVDAPESPDFNKRVEWLEEELTNQFEMKGLKQSDDNPDLLINIGIVLVEKIQTRETDIRTDAPKYIGHMNYSWQSETVEVGTYHKGTVVVHFVDSEDKTLVWEGIAESVIVENEEKSRKNIATGAKQMFRGIN